ncbi:MAG TPA: capsular biosynthesis protein [Pararhizobium sp.]|nr:capsular biosynthesis protein [Pararhizobium sp.]
MSRQQTLDPTTIAYALRQKGNVMKAVMLRDMRTRFFNHGLGFLVVPLWPLAHLVILLAIYHLVGRAAPYGSSLDIFFATGLIPTLAFMYVSRFMALSLIINRPMLSFPAVKTTDILFGRAALEAVAACLMAALTFFMLLAVGDNPYPIDPLQAFFAFAAVLVLGVGVGVIIGVLCMINELIITAYYLFVIVIYITSGTLFVPSALPAPIVAILKWSPMVQSVEWMRNAVIPGYPDQILNKTYLVGCALTTVMIGLGLERLLRARLLQK